MNKDILVEAARFALDILADRNETPGNRTYSGMLVMAIRANNYRSIKIQLERITTPGAQDLLRELNEPVSTEKIEGYLFDF